jgi:mutator protein MutT
MSRAVSVAVAVLRHPEDGSILLCQRPAHKPWPLEWEFPGGKVEPNETDVEALRRELREELGIEAVIGPLLHHERAHYPDGTLFSVAYHRVDQWQGEVVNLDFAAIRWITLQELDTFTILQGNQTFVELLGRGSLL